MQLYLYHFFELLSTLLALFFYRNLRERRMGILLPFLMFISVAEYLAILQRNIFYTSTYAINYLILLVEWLFYNLLFLRFTRQKLYLKYLHLSVPLMSVCIAASYFFYPVFYPAFYYCIISAGFLLSVAALGYMYSLFLDDQKQDLMDDPVGWVAVGVVFFFSGVSIVFSLYQLIQVRKVYLWGEPIYTLVPRMLSIFLYSCISIAIIKCRKIIPSSSVS
jgi:hypothetical protein